MFDQRVFDLCKRFQIEPVFSDKTLGLICSKEPPKEFLQELTALIPEGTIVEGMIGLRRNTVAIVNLFVLTFRGEIEEFSCPNLGEVILRVVTPEDNMALAPENSVWDQIVSRLVADPFTEQYTIYRNGVEVRKGTAKKEEVPSEPKINNQIVLPRKDNRFDYDRDYLPPDIGTDIRIALETTQDSKAFLQSLGVEI